MSIKTDKPNDFLDLITYITAFWHLHGELPSADKAKQDGVPKALFEQALVEDDFLEALQEQGVVVRRLNDDWASQGLTFEQLTVANILLDLQDKRSQKKKLQDLGVSTTTYNAWLRDPAFRAYSHGRAEAVFGDHAHEAQMALIDNILSGDLKSIMYYNEMTGKFVPQRAGVNQVDVHSLIVKIVEILDDELPDGDVKLRIGERLKRLISVNNMATAIVESANGTPVTPELVNAPVGGVDSTIEQPVVVPTRKVDLGTDNEGLM